VDIKAIQALSQNDMTKVNDLIYGQLHSDVALINQLGVYIVNAGGKRMRPMLTVLTAQALNSNNPEKLGDEHCTIAAIIEFIHTATLLHDDVVDESNMRRGRETANALFGNAASVLVGDFLYTRSFQMMTKLGDMRIMDILSDATNIVAEGEVLQLMNCNDPDTTEESYLHFIYCKTAKIFEAATRLAAVVTKQNSAIETAMADYGKYLGTAFQLVDDIMDYTADAKEMGKNVGDDLFYRLNVYPILIPPLRERSEDIPLLTTHFLTKYYALYNKKTTGITDKAMQALTQYKWPGNIRELENMIERGVILTDNNQAIDMESFFPSLSEPTHPLNVVNSQGQLTTATLPSEKNDNLAVDDLLENEFSLDELEKQLIEKAMELTNGNISKAARKLGLTRPSLAYRLKKLQERE
jgi:octaprenyl-diphosphate synthase